MKDNYFEHLENQRNNEYERDQLLRKRAEYEYYKNKKNTFYGILFAIIGSVILLTKDILFDFIDNKYSIIVIMTGAMLFAIGAGLLLFRYLQNGVFNKINNSNYSEQKIRLELQDLKVEILKLRKKSGEPTDSENISQTINNVIDDTLTEDFIKSKIDGIYREKVISELKHKNLLEDFESLSLRINGELSRLRKSANLNLVIGTLTTLLAITALGYEVFKTDVEFTDTVKLLSHYLPRLSLIIFIEIFAFFFLKLYKATLEDIKYFNNEKTNIDFKLISLKSALNNSNDKLITLVIEELVKTERNFKLSKGESTVELEKNKNNNETNQIISQFIEKLKTLT